MKKQRFKKLSHSIYECKYHVVFCPKYRYRYLKGKVAIRIFEKYKAIGKQYWGRHFWSRGYCVSTVGLDEEKIVKYVKWQEQQEGESGQDGLFS